VGALCALAAGGAPAGANAADDVAPTISVTTPHEGQRFLLNSTVASSFSCADNFGGSGVATCSGDSGINTSSVGNHVFVVTATDHAGNTSQSLTNYVVFADTTAPVVAITNPITGEHFAQNSVVSGAFGCADETGGSGVASCVGPAQIDTSTLGAHNFSVTGTDNSGNHSTITVPYVVDPADVTAPTITVTVPAEGQHFAHQDAVSSVFSCSDGSGVSGVANCSGPPILDTSTVGPHTFTVTAADNAGNAASKTVNYVVDPDDFTAPTVAVNSPVEGAHYAQGSSTATSFACADNSGGSGMASCSAPSKVDTAAAGPHTFTATGIDRAGNASSVVINYVVDPAPDTTPPTIAVATPTAGQHVFQGATIATSFSCADNAGGSGIATCVGPAAVDTATLGAHALSFGASDKAGNQSTVVVKYVVDKPLSIGVLIPTVAATSSGPTKAQKVNSALGRLYGSSSLTLTRTGKRALKFSAPTAGVLSVRWKSGRTTVASGSKTFGKAGTKTLTLTLTKAGKRLLKKKSGHKLPVTSTATFAPDSGGPQTKAKQLTLKG
jgi:hypothetical protein